MQPLTIGLFGFGCVGQGLHYTLEHSTGFRAKIRKIAVKDRQKQRSLDSSLFTFDKRDILDDAQINVVVELIDDADEAFEIVREAICKGKHVVTANKKMLALHLEELLHLQREHRVSLLYEAAACGSIPVIRSLEEYFDNEELVRISGIFNGTSNYILTKTIREGLSYGDALSKAQELGFAESDPSSDVEGFDAQYKTAIIALHAFGIRLSPGDIFRFGISALRREDIGFAKEKGWQIKSLATIQLTGDNALSAFVMPAFVRPDNHLSQVHNEFNGVIVQGMFSGEQFLQGRGAGGLPTGAAVLSDISALSYGYQYEYKKFRQGNSRPLDRHFPLRIYFRYHNHTDIERLGFDRIAARYEGENHCYAIGDITLDKLRQHYQWLTDQQLFIASLENES